jgi:hypothetical protein
VPNPSRKEIARSLREAGNHEAALAVLLDFTPRANGTADNDGEGAAAPAAGAPTTLSAAWKAADASGGVLGLKHLRSLTGDQMSALQRDHKDLLFRSMAQLKAGE